MTRGSQREVQTFDEALATNRSIKKLVLNRTGIEDEAATAIAEGLCIRASPSVIASKRIPRDDLEGSLVRPWRV